MDTIKGIDNIIQRKQFNIKRIIFMSLVIFGIYGILMCNLLISKNSFEFTEKDFKLVINLILAIMGILSCKLSYNSNSKDELFIMALMYTMFFVDILNSNLTGYMLNTNNEYSAIITSFFRLGIVYISLYDSKKIRKIIVDNKLESLIITATIASISIYLEYNYLMPYNEVISVIYKYYNVVLTILYIRIAIKFFKKSIYTKEYIYSVIGASTLMFSIKSMYDLYYLINPNSKVALIADTTILIGFIIFIIGLFIELNQKNSDNKILDEQRSLFIKTIEENQHSSIIICDENYIIKYKNKRTANVTSKLIDVNLHSLEIGNKFDILEIFEGISDINQVEKQLLKKGSYIKDIYTKKDNNILDLSIHLLEINNKKYKVLSIRDVSEKYKLERALLEYEAIKEEDKMKNEFFANISHELKTPLNIIYSTNQLLDISMDKSNFKDLYARYSTSLNINCKRMLRLIDNIVDMAKFGVEFKSPNYNNYNIVNVIEEMTMSVVNYANIKGIDLVFDTEEEEVNIKCDLDMLERIVLNLLSNAVKFSDEGSSIFVKISKNDNWVSIKVKDNGIGIDPEIQPRIFDRFVQGDKSIRRKKEGSGIGLSLVKSFVELMDGKIYLNSDGKNGTEFTVLLPNKLIESNIEENQVDYFVDLERVQLELSDIYEVYEHTY